MNTTSWIALAQFLAFAAAFIATLRETEPVAEPGPDERAKGYGLIAASGLCLLALTAALDWAKWQHLPLTLALISGVALLYLPLSTAGEDEDDDSPASFMYWARMSLAVCLSLSALAGLLVAVFLPA